MSSKPLSLVACELHLPTSRRVPHSPSGTSFRHLCSSCGSGQAVFAYPALEGHSSCRRHARVPSAIWLQPLANRAGKAVQIMARCAPIVITTPRERSGSFTARMAQTSTAIIGQHVRNGNKATVKDTVYHVSGRRADKPPSGSDLRRNSHAVGPQLLTS